MVASFFSCGSDPAERLPLPIGILHLLRHGNRVGSLYPFCTAFLDLPLCRFLTESVAEAMIMMKVRKPGLVSTCIGTVPVVEGDQVDQRDQRRKE